MTLTLKDPTDEQLNTAFAEHVCGYHFGPASDSPEEYWQDPYGAAVKMQPWTSSFDAVLPFLENKNHPRLSVMIRRDPEDDFWEVAVLPIPEDGDMEGVDAEMAKDKSLPRACVIALLRHKGVRVEVSPQPETERTP